MIEYLGMQQKICIVTDDNAELTKEEINKFDIKVINMPLVIDGEVYFENINITKDEFLDLLNKDVDIKTSQPSPGIILETWSNLLKEYDYIIHIPMSSGLSNSYQTALSLSEDFPNRVFVIDNHRISVTLKQSIFDCITLINENKSPKEIKEILEKEGSNASIYIAVDTLKYLKKGGRITPAGYLIGDALHVKPTLSLYEGKLDVFKKSIGNKAAINTIKIAIFDDLKNKFKDYSIDDLKISFAYTGKDDTLIKRIANEIYEELGIKEIPIIDHLSLSITTHIGEGAIAATISKVIK